MPNFEILCPFLVLCEGDSDSETFKVLTKKFQIEGIQFFHPHHVLPKPEDNNRQREGKEQVEGTRDNYARAFHALTKISSFKKLKGIIFLVDSDLSPASALQKAQNSLKQTKFGVPSSFLTPIKGEVGPPVLLASVPWIDQKGALETLIESAFKNRYPIAWACVESFFECIDSRNGAANPKSKPWSAWSPQKKSKARLSALIAGVCVDDPATSVTAMWQSNRGLTDLLDDEAFTPFVEFFRNLESYFATTP
jgi:hypothetical protein